MDLNHVCPGDVPLRCLPEAPTCGKFPCWKKCSYFSMCPYGRVHLLSSEHTLVQIPQTYWKTSCTRKVAQGEGCLACFFTRAWLFVRKSVLWRIATCLDSFLGVAYGGGIVVWVQQSCWHRQSAWGSGQVLVLCWEIEDEQMWNTMRRGKWLGKPMRRENRKIKTKMAESGAHTQNTFEETKRRKS